MLYMYVISIWDRTLRLVYHSIYGPYLNYPKCRSYFSGNANRTGAIGRIAS